MKWVNSLQTEISESISRLWTNQNSVVATLEQTNRNKGQLLMRVKQHLEVLSVKSLHFFPRADSVIRIRRFIYLFQKGSSYTELARRVISQLCAPENSLNSGRWVGTSLHSSRFQEQVHLKRYLRADKTAWDDQKRCCWAGDAQSCEHAPWSARAITQCPNGGLYLMSSFVTLV